MLTILLAHTLHDISIHAMRCTFHSLVGTLLLGYLDASKSQKADGDNAAAAAFASPPAIAKPRAPGKDIPSSINDGFAMPAPRPPKGAAVPSLLGSKNEESGEDEEELLS
mmetsp:Transcript_4552/g.8869  ORF Transcript_4552/g.8869 Transcript_4552/m.8869 type:complete len:110 (+) Transcript_4552:175-504(+)